ncbi:hypothetical protein [Streptacidiphilus sp. MAP5-3]|uniref:hypothetical protein n=1 Tax=unclassified Streptacidiphilus TaxID=2643834 RepID=UPI003516B11B
MPVDTLDTLDTLDARTTPATPAAHRPRPAATSSLLAATVVPSRGVLGRLAAVLSAHHVLALSYANAGEAVRARVEVQVPCEHAERVRAKLLRVVDVTDVTIVERGRPDQP